MFLSPFWPTVAPANMRKADEGDSKSPLRGFFASHSVATRIPRGQESVYSLPKRRFLYKSRDQVQEEVWRCVTVSALR